MRSRTLRVAVAPLLLLLAGCCYLGGYTTPEGITDWQDPTPPRLSLAEKERYYQQRIEESFQTREGLLRYRRDSSQAEDGSYGGFADGCFHTGIYLASQSLRWASTGDAAAREQILQTLDGLQLLLEVTGKKGLLARHFSPAGTIEPKEKWKLSTSRPGYVWRSDVSKDQYAGFIFGLGVTLAVVEDEDILARVRELASAVADHLRENGLLIIDVNGEVTTHGNLRGRIWCAPIGVNALISLAIAKVAAVATGESRHREFYQRLVDAGYPGISYWAYFALFGVTHRVNDNMGYLALYPLFLLEKDAAILETLREGEQRTWGEVQHDRNVFFSFVHAAATGDDGVGAAGRTTLLEFPDDKVQWPVDLTREGFDFPRTFFNSRKCLPQTTSGVPLYLRPKSSSFWAANPYRLVGNLGPGGVGETAGVDFLQAYWMGRFHGFIGPDD